MRKKILIIGNSANAYALAKKLSEDNDVFVAPGSSSIGEFAICVDIRENSSSELYTFPSILTPLLSILIITQLKMIINTIFTKT